MINNFPYHQVTRQDRFAGKFCQAFREETIPIIYKFFKKIKAEKILSNVTLILLPEPDRHHQKRRLIISHVHLSCTQMKTASKILSN